MTTKYSVQITYSAQSDIAHIHSCIAADNPANAVKFILELEEKCFSLETFPERHPFIPENQYFGTDYRHRIHKNYRVVYRIAETKVFILRVLHGTRLLEQ